MNKFIAGIEEKYPKELLEGRLTVEGNVISCLYKDPLLVDECNFKQGDFITKDGTFYYGLARKLRNAGYSAFDEVTILSTISGDVLEQFESRGGYDTIRNMVEVINDKNVEKYLDNLYRENIMLGMHRDGFNLLKPLDFEGKMIAPYKLFRKMDSESVLDFYESRLSEYGTGYSSKVLEEEELEISDDFISSIEEGLENGVDFGTAGDDINLEDMRCFPFLSKHIAGFMHGTTNVVAGFSSSGKTTFWITIVMSLLYRGEKVLIISNEQKSKVFKINFLVWVAYKYFRYYKLTKKKLTTGDLNDEEREMLKKCQKYFNDNYKGKLKFIAIPDSDMGLVKKKIRQNALRWGYTTVLYDTLKVELKETGSSEASWLSLIRDSRTLDALAKKYDLIMLASLQLASHMIGRLWLSADCLSTSKQVVEVLENLLMLRTAYQEELDPNNKKYYCNPYQLKKVGDTWIKEECEIDPTSTYKFLFLEKVRNGSNSGDTGDVLMYRFKGSHGVLQEQFYARPKHGVIGNS